MRLFGFEFRRVLPDPPQGASKPPATYIITYTPEDRVINACEDARLVLAHLLRGRTGSRREMERSGMSNRRWDRAVWMLAASGVIGAPRSGLGLELTCLDPAKAHELVTATRGRLLDNLRNPNYKLAFD